MNKLVLILVYLFCATELYSQEIITESNYLKEDSLLWIDYGKQQEKLSQYWTTMPDKKDSIQSLFKEIYEKVSKANNRIGYEICISSQWVTTSVYDSP